MEDFKVNIIERQQEEIEALKSQLRKKDEEIASLTKQNEWYIEQLKLRQKQKFGVSSGLSDENQITIFDFFDEAESLNGSVETDSGEMVFVPAHTRCKAKRGSKVDALPVETIYYKIPEVNQVCDICGSALTEMKKEIRKEIKIVPAQVSIVEHVTYVYSCRNCDKNGLGGFIKKAESPKAMIPKSMASPSMMAYILNQKYTNGMSLYQQEMEFKRLGVHVSRQNLSNWIVKGAELLNPLAQAMKKELLGNELLHVDNAILGVFHEPGLTSNSKSMWVYRTSACAKRPVLLYDYREGQVGHQQRHF